MPKNAEKNTTTLSRIENKSTLKHVRLAASGSIILIVLIYKYIWSGVRSRSSNISHLHLIIYAYKSVEQPWSLMTWSYFASSTMIAEVNSTSLNGIWRVKVG